ncbi:ferredoxin [Streptomyces sp. NBC_01210]|uniref:ferredoxin n=1 Tax=Streptomyces sp. NBC_01210 TaxID=2903774 RepID=UPI002E1609CE|nr:ferredoxin [Streptomyces sp. NBC_01210]
MRITVDRERCVGSGNCVRIAPDLFEQGDDGLVCLVPGAAPDMDDQEAAEAADLCPAAAIAYLGE